MTQAAETPDTPTLKSAVLARFVAETRYEDLPEDVVAKAERHILDTIGAGVAGAVSKEAHLLRAALLHYANDRIHNHNQQDDDGVYKIPIRL